MPLKLMTMLNQKKIERESGEKLALPTQVVPVEALYIEKPAIIEINTVRFLITDSPMESNILKYLEMFKKYDVKIVCQANKSTYHSSLLSRENISVYDTSFKDGDPPPDDVIDKWLAITEQSFFGTNSLKHVQGPIVKKLAPHQRVGVHCVAGLGRSPLLVAVALVEFCFMSPQEAVGLIREKRKGAINKKQFRWLEEYKRRTRKFNTCLCPIV